MTQSNRYAKLRVQRGACERELREAYHALYELAAQSLVVTLDERLMRAVDAVSFKLGRVSMAHELEAQERRALNAIAAQSSKARRQFATTRSAT